MSVVPRLIHSSLNLWIVYRRMTLSVSQGRLHTLQEVSFVKEVHSTLKDVNL